MSQKSRRGGRSRARSGHATIADVAARADVAPITVSRVINDPTTVSERLRARVEAAITELGYVPNRLAGGLASASTRVIPIIVPSLANIVFIEVIQGAQTTLEGAGYQILLGNTDYDLEREASLVETLLGWSPAGMIVAGLRHLEPTVKRLRHWGRPLVEVMEYGGECLDMNVGLSHEAAGAAQAEHLVERGYRDILYVGARLARDYRAEQRYLGHRRTLEAAGIEPKLLTYEEASTYELGGRALLQARHDHPGLEAVHFANDDLAVGAILNAQRHRIAVPGQIAIAGFNGLPISAHTTPRLTTVVSPRYRIGQLAAEMLLARLHGTPFESATIDVGFELAVREST
ncbi:HTH-type transcriptional regulator GntR [wastewater metagenome]|uniref:HTH-type transcriptional regulator GntR n=2 Tax=unclassified sequences TaxID=12908 RepID=A0A5B8RBX0_9ZZZZ|nr:HTH-type transcriptional regulator GntR [uncultured organism]